MKLTDKQSQMNKFRVIETFKTGYMVLCEKTSIIKRVEKPKNNDLIKLIELSKMYFELIKDNYEK